MGDSNVSYQKIQKRAKYSQKICQDVKATWNGMPCDVVERIEREA